MKYYFLNNLKLIIRVPVALFFQFFFPLMMMLIVVGANANTSYDGIRFINYYLPCAISMGFIPLALVTFPLWVGKKIENGSLLRMNYFGLRTHSIIFMDIICHVIFGVIGAAIDIIFALIVFRLQFFGAGYFFAFILQIFIALITLLVWGGVLSLIVKNTQALMSIGLVIMFFLYFISNCFGNVNNFPVFIRDLAKGFPVSYVGEDFSNIWIGKQYWCGKFLWISAIWFGVGIIVLVSLALSNKRLRGNAFLKSASTPRRKGKVVEV
ncbi:MAG: ABC transporter permease [Aeriscardovia sp.]|nr:ABC transporter permease [Aeriscardovia sp.]